MLSKHSPDGIHVRGCKIMSFPKIEDERGNLTFFESTLHVHYEFKRIFYLYDVPAGAERGGHALKRCHQLLIAVAGSFDVIVDDGDKRQRINLHSPHHGLQLAPMVWREMNNFSAGAVCLVVASERYSESDYFRDYAGFHEALRKSSIDVDSGRPD